MSLGDHRHVLDELVARVEPARPERGIRAVSELARSMAKDELSDVGVLVGRIAAMGGARTVHRTVLVCGADHGTAPDRTSAPALAAIASGEAAVCAAARSADASVVVVDCGVHGARPSPGVLEFRIGDGTRDLRIGPAMTEAEALASVHTGVALSFSLANTGLDVVGLGAIGAGHRESTEALFELGGEIIAGVTPPLDALARVGGFEIGVLCGVIVGAASIQIPVVLDGPATVAAAVMAAALCPAATGYLIATHGGGSEATARGLALLGLSPLTRLGVARGEGTGAAMALGMVAAAARIASEIASEIAPEIA